MSNNPIKINNPIRNPMCYQPSRPGMYGLPKGKMGPIFVNNYYDNLPGMENYWASMYNKEADKWDEIGQWTQFSGLALSVIGNFAAMFKKD